ncbi:MAG: trk/ktr system potassium uptake protein [Clostridiales bacterium]|nr:trk/ktr system potassium uptake protein [Clostridiales bacterium]MDK2933490.1 trk/ktr system potassium uptake protein [Clostridiales bacterium]
MVLPEKDMGARVAQNLVSKNILDYIELSPKYSIIEIIAPSSWVHQSLKQLNVRVKYGINIMAIKKAKTINVSPKADDMIEEGDVLVVIGANEDIARVGNIE